MAKFVHHRLYNQKQKLFKTNWYITYPLTITHKGYTEPIVIIDSPSCNI